MTEENTPKVDRRIIAREFRPDLDEQVQDMETKGWELEEDAEIEPYRPNPSSPPWPTVLMTRPVDHPNVLPELRQANHELRNQVGALTREFRDLRNLYQVVAEAMLGPTFRNAQGLVAADENRDRFGPKRIPLVVDEDIDK